MTSLIPCSCRLPRLVAENELVALEGNQSRRRLFAAYREATDANIGSPPPYRDAKALTSIERVSSNARNVISVE
jgi:hypothetical protein